MRSSERRVFDFHQSRQVNVGRAFALYQQERVLLAKLLIFLFGAIERFLKGLLGQQDELERFVADVLVRFVEERLIALDDGFEDALAFVRFRTAELKRHDIVGGVRIGGFATIAPDGQILANGIADVLWPFTRKRFEVRQVWLLCRPVHDLRAADQNRLRGHVIVHVCNPTITAAAGQSCVRRLFRRRAVAPATDRLAVSARRTASPIPDRA